MRQLCLEFASEMLPDVLAECARQLPISVYAHHLGTLIFGDLGR